MNFRVSLVHTITRLIDTTERKQLVTYFVVSTDVDIELDSKHDTQTLAQYSLPKPKKNDVFAWLMIGYLNRKGDTEGAVDVRTLYFSPEITHSVDNKLLAIVERHVIHLTVRYYGLTLLKSAYWYFVYSWKKLDEPPYSLVLDAVTICLFDTMLFMLYGGRDGNESCHTVLFHLAGMLSAQGRYRDAAWIFIDYGSRMIDDPTGI